MAADIRLESKVLTPEFLKVLNQIDAKTVFPNFMEALTEVTTLYRQQWIQYALGSPIPGTPRVIHSTGAYVQSIQVDANKDLEKVISADGRINEFIEKGHGSIDLKPGLLKGPKHRVNAKHEPYNIVAFRHGTPGSNRNPMPINVYNLARNLTQSSVVGKQMVGGVQRNVYRWGTRLKKGTPGVGKNYEGMVRMAQDTAKAKSSGYITFRTVSVRSKGWIVPPLEGIPIREIVVREVAPIAADVLKKALEMDLGK